MTLDLVTIGRANLDLYSQDVGRPFAEISGFDAMVGGSPTNIAIGVSRLGLRSAVLTAVGDDPTGDFVLRYLADEGVSTEFVPRVEGKATSLALIGVEPPDRFPLTFYREDPADIYLTPDDVSRVDFAQVRAAEVSGNALSRGPCVSAVHAVLDKASDLGVTVFVDVDLRPTEWPDLAAFGAAVRGILASTDVLIGTEEELWCVFMPDPDARGVDDPLSDDERHALDVEVERATVAHSMVTVTKRGPRGATLRTPDRSADISGFPVEVVNTVGAGDSFAAGLISSRLTGSTWDDAIRFGNACGAITVTRHGCSSAFPSAGEVREFTARYDA